MNKLLKKSALAIFLVAVIAAACFGIIASRYGVNDGIPSLRHLIIFSSLMGLGHALVWTIAINVLYKFIQKYNQIEIDEGTKYDVFSRVLVPASLPIILVWGYSLWAKSLHKLVDARQTMIGFGAALFFSGLYVAFGYSRAIANDGHSLSITKTGIAIVVGSLAGLFIVAIGSALVVLAAAYV